MPLHSRETRRRDADDERDRRLDDEARPDERAAAGDNARAAAEQLRQ